MKYVMLYIKPSLMADIEPRGRYVPVIFPRLLTHSVMAGAARRAVFSEGIASWRVEVVSAGFLSQNNQCFGKSESLGLSAHDDDTNIIAEYHSIQGRCYDSRGVE